MFALAGGSHAGWAMGGSVDVWEEPHNRERGQQQGFHQVRRQVSVWEQRLCAVGGVSVAGCWLESRGRPMLHDPQARPLQPFRLGIARRDPFGGGATSPRLDQSSAAIDELPAFCVIAGSPSAAPPVNARPTRDSSAALARPRHARFFLTLFLLVAYLNLALSRASCPDFPIRAGFAGSPVARPICRATCSAHILSRARHLSPLYIPICCSFQSSFLSQPEFVALCRC